MGSLAAHLQNQLDQARAERKSLADQVRVLSDREFVDRNGEPCVTSNAAYQEILHLRERVAELEALRTITAERVWAALKEECASTPDKSQVHTLVTVRERDVRAAWEALNG